MFMLMPWPPFEEIVLPETTPSPPSKIPIPSLVLPEIVFPDSDVGAVHDANPRAALFNDLNTPTVIFWMLLPTIVAEDVGPTKTPRPLALRVLP